MLPPYLYITPSCCVPREELTFRTSRSGGPGGQHVNKVETRVELLFDVAGSPSLTSTQRELLLEELRGWIDTEGLLHLVSDSFRSQYRNREEVIARFVNLLRHALRPRTPRKPTRIPRSAHERRLQAKKLRGDVKRLRRVKSEE